MERQTQKSCPDLLTTMRKNIIAVLRYGNLVPFNWYTKGFRCFYCAEVIIDCYLLKEHTLRHSDVDLDEFVTNRIIRKDVPVKIDVSQMSCKYCPEIALTSIEDLITHISETHEQYDGSAGVCFFPFVLEKEAMRCMLCENSYDTFAALIGHMYRMHISHSFVCQICGMSYKDNVRLKRHSLTHAGHRCSVCEKTFETYSKLVKHKQRFHGQIQLFGCNLCSQKFENVYQVNVHKGKVHKVEKHRIKCEYCPKICMTKGAMNLHVACQHSKVKYQCELCDYTSGIKWQVKLHQRKHSGVKEYSCSICEKHFGRSSNLRTHMKVHTGSEGRVCRTCRKGFTDAATLKKHELKSHY